MSKRDGYIRKQVGFNPNRDYLEKAIEEFLSRGGCIQVFEFDDDSFQRFMLNSESPYAVDAFLRGE